MSDKTLAQRIFEIDDVETKTITVPEWGDLKLELRSPNGAERADLQRAFIDMDEAMATGKVVMRDMTAMYPAIIIACAYDPETGERVFEQSPQTVDWLNRKRGDVLERIAMEAMPLVGLSMDDVEEKKGDSSTSPLNESHTS